MKKIFLLFIAFTLYLPLSAQQVRIIKQWYDTERLQLKREYSVLAKNPKVLEGPLVAYYSNGRFKMRGHYKQNKQTGLWEYFYENGNVKMSGLMQSGKPQGQWMYFYENGRLSQRGEWNQGVKNGSWKYFYENGELQSEGNIEEDKYVGAWKYYYEDGKPKATAFFENGEGTYKEFHITGKLKMKGTIVDGKSEGPWQYFYENGSLKSEGVEKRGLRDGLWRFYHPNGVLSGEGNYAQGETVGQWKYFHQNGKLSAEGEEMQGQREGHWKLYYESGKFKAEGTFSGGDGPYQEYYESGKLKIAGALEKGKSNGSWKYYYEDGTVEGTCFFRDGEGMYSGYHKNGQLKMKGKIKDGQRVGTWTLHHEDGTLAGHYSAIYESELALLPLPEVTLNIVDTLEEVQLSKKPDIVLKRRRIRYFKPSINETRTVILGINPIAVLFGSLPVSAEYYMQERQGIELRITAHKEPFFSNLASLPVGAVSKSGASIDIRHKLYHPDRYIDTWYFGHEARFSYLSNSIMQGDTIQGEFLVRKVNLYEHRLEYSLLAGSRIFRPIGKNGLSLDIFIGVGVGYRHFTRGWSPVIGDFDKYFPVLYKKEFYMPFRLGFSAGYYF
jgi:antitoxin component YwqK of YwqJK toxin-antitoxin module